MPIEDRGLRQATARRRAKPLSPSVAGMFSRAHPARVSGARCSRVSSLFPFASSILRTHAPAASGNKTGRPRAPFTRGKELMLLSFARTAALLWQMFLHSVLIRLAPKPSEVLHFQAGFVVEATPCLSAGVGNLVGTPLCPLKQAVIFHLGDNRISTLHPSVCFFVSDGVRPFGWQGCSTKARYPPSAVAGARCLKACGRKGTTSFECRQGRWVVGR